MSSATHNDVLKRTGPDSLPAVPSSADAQVSQGAGEAGQAPETTPPFVAIVPARLASTRLPDKPLADIGGRPMVVHVAQRAQRSGAMQVIVATDSERVVEAVKAFGFDVMLTRADHPSGTDRLAEVATRLGWSDDTLVVNVQGDEPLIDPALIADVAHHLAERPDCAIATAAHPVASIDEAFDPNAVKVVIDARGTALYFSRAPIPWFRDSYRNVFQSHAAADVANSRSMLTLDASIPVYRHIGIYAYRAGFLRRYPTLAVSPLEQAESLEQLRAIWHGERIAVKITDAAPPPGVDTPEDLARARAAFAADAGATMA